ncbi:MAG: lysophospholipase [Solirubrobacteraceae bacterium]|nr:lysophospholipase [Solirubrobacteraceae bacterium]
MRLGSFVGEGGLRIAYRSWAPRSPRAPRATVVVVHTALDHSARYDEFARLLVRRGMTVWAHDQRGHGHSDGAAGVIDKLEHATADLGQVVDLATRDHGAPCFVVAHSMGAVVALSYALDHQERLAGLVTTAATLDSSPAPLPLRLLGDVFHLDRIAAQLTPRFPLLAFPSHEITTDPGEAEAHATDPLIHHGRMPMRTASELAHAIRGALTKRLGELHLPVLAFHGAEDPIVGPSASRRLHDAVSSQDRTLSVLDGLRHDLFHERQPQRRQLFEQIADWIEARA